MRTSGIRTSRDRTSGGPPVAVLRMNETELRGLTFKAVIKTCLLPDSDWDQKMIMLRTQCENLFTQSKDSAAIKHIAGYICVTTEEACYIF